MIRVTIKVTLVRVKLGFDGIIPLLVRSRKMVLF